MPIYKGNNEVTSGNNQTGGSQTSRTNTLIVSVEETDVYQAQSASASYTRTS
jgi:hypothetical protein